MPKETTRAAIYIRVSTHGQEDLSPDSQKKLAIDYAKKHNMIVTDEYIFYDGGISGRKADRRPEFQRMIALAKKGCFDVILVWKFSRFARNQEESIVYKNMLRRDKVDVISISEPILDGPFGSLIERIIEWMDEYYSVRLSGDVFRGMSEKAERGFYQCRPPLGYRIPYHNAMPEIIPEEAEVVRSIFSQYVEQGHSIFEITRHLNSLGLKTSHGKPFQKRSVEYILKNPAYAGNIRWNMTNNETKTVKDKDEWIQREGHHPAIISNELFAAAQDRLDREYKPKNARPSETTKHWLSGIIKCSACGRTLSCSSRKDTRNGKVYRNFQCYGYLKALCTVSHQVSEKIIGPVVLEALRAAIGAPPDEYIPRQPVKKEDANALKLLQMQLEKVDQKEQRTKEAYICGIDTIEEYKVNKQRLADERADLLARIEKETAAAVPKTDSTGERFSDHLRSVYDMLMSDEFTDMQKNAALKTVVSHIVYHKAEQKIVVHYYSPWS